MLKGVLTAKVREASKPIIVHFDGKNIIDYTGSTDKSKDRRCVLYKLRGACSSLAQFHDRPLLELACRHHVGEVHINHFNYKVAGKRTVGPENQLFKSLQVKLVKVKLVKP